MAAILRRWAVYFSLNRFRQQGLTPAQIVCLSFGIGIFVGTLLLLLPISHAAGAQIHPVDAFFTATSALCVTGLAAIDISSHFNRFGQFVILLLIQIGGLGIISIGTLLALFSGRRIGFRARMNLQTQIGSLYVGGVVRLLKQVLILVLSMELAGMLLLLPSFVAVEGWGNGIFFALFYSINAFNHAGFGLYPDSLMQFVDNLPLNLVIMTQIVVGSLGFVVLVDLFSHLNPKQERKPLTLHSKIVLLTTAVLIVGGTIIILIFEWSNQATLGPLSWPNKLLASLFQAITPRTAGFHTLNYSEMRPGTLIFTMLLMFIGGSPGSTAGGIKTITFFVLLCSAWSISRGRTELTVFGRHIALTAVLKAGSIALISMIVLGAAATLLTFTDREHGPLVLGFEAVSAFGTAGLSTGITSQLTPLSKLILIALMYLGRLGPLTLALALVERKPDRRINYPTEDIIIA